MPIRGASGGGAVALDSLTDVVLTASTKNDIIQFDGTNWVNRNYLILGDAASAVNLTTGRVLDIRQNCRNAVTQSFLQYNASGFTGTASGIWRGLQMLVTGTIGYTGGSLGGQALFLVINCTLGANVTVSELLGGNYQLTPSETNSGTQGINILTGHKATTLGPSVANTGHVGTLLRGFNSDISQRNKSYDKMMGFDCTLNTGGAGVVTDVELFGTSSAGWGGVACTNFYVLRFNAAAASGTNKYGIYINNVVTKSVFGHSVCIGATQDPIHGLDSQSSLGLKITANKVAAYNAASETVIPCDANAGAFAVNLPTAVGIAGRTYIIKKVDATANAVTVTPNGAETIDGAATVVLNAQWQVTRIISNGANWLII